jgi:hypothetical protein
MSESNGHVEQAPPKLPTITVTYDPATQQTNAAWSPEFKNFEFVAAVLSLAIDRVEKVRDAVQMQQMQAQLEAQKQGQRIAQGIALR